MQGNELDAELADLETQAVEDEVEYGDDDYMSNYFDNGEDEGDEGAFGKDGIIFYKLLYSYLTRLFLCNFFNWFLIFFFSDGPTID